MRSGIPKAAVIRRARFTNQPNLDGPSEFFSYARAVKAGGRSHACESNIDYLCMQKACLSAIRGDGSVVAILRLRL